MADTVIVKRIAAIGAQLVELDRQRNEIDFKTKRLIAEIHKLTRMPDVEVDGDGAPALVENGGQVRLVRNNAPTLRARVLTLLAGAAKPLTKWEVAHQVGVEMMQAHYCLTDLYRKHLIDRVAQSTYAVNERGKAECAKMLPAAAPTKADEPVVIVTEGSPNG